MKIYQVRQYFDAGPNDQGWVVGYEYATSREEAEKRYDGTVWAHELTEQTYKELKEEAEKNLNLFKL